MHFPFPILVADIGGTNVRLALVEAPGKSRIDLPEQRTADHANLASAVTKALAGAAIRPRAMLACAAGPVVGRTVKLTNAAWMIDGPCVAAALGLEQGILLNDFEAQALSIPSLKPQWLHPIGEERSGDGGPRLIHGPGTGLGTAALVNAGGRWLAVASEASHSDFAPVTEEERAIWPFVERRHGRLTPETLISGPGLARLHRARMACKGERAGEIDSAEIIARASMNDANNCARTVRVFWRLCARFSGDMAMAFVASGGVILAGGILPRILHPLDPDDFRAAFENRAPYTDFARRIPVSILVEKNTVLEGLGAISAAPDKYALDYAGRAWVSA